MKHEKHDVNIDREPIVETLYNQAMESQPVARPRVIVVGAGFGGLSAARALVNQDVDVLLLDRNNYHGFWPLLYQVATAGLEPESIAYPVRAIARKYANVTFVMAAVRGVDFAHKLVHTDGLDIAYDYLVLAAGSTTNYFGNEALAHQTCGLKDIDDAERLRNHMLAAFEQAVRERNPERRAALMTVAIVGGGPTGVELAGACVELIRHVLRKDYPMLDMRQARVVLVEAHDRILASFPARLQQRAQRRLERMGVEVKLNARVDSVEQSVIAFRDGTRLAAGTVVWAAGVRGAPLADTLDVELAPGARVKIAPTLTLPRRPEVFVIGDMAYLEGYKGGGPSPCSRRSRFSRASRRRATCWRRSRGARCARFATSTRARWRRLAVGRRCWTPSVSGLTDGSPGLAGCWSTSSSWSVFVTG